MFWADQVAQKLKQREFPLEWVDDMKTPSGKIHVGALMGVVIHDLIYRALIDAGINAKYTYVFDNHDPMDGLPVYLPKEEYDKYMGMPLYKVPPPVKGFANYAEYYAKDFMNTFNAIGSHPEIIWATDLYLSGRMNEGIQLVLDEADKIRKIYEQMYKKQLSKDWYPFNVYCQKCAKVSTTKVYAWDGKEISYRCEVNAVNWTKGCGYEGKTSPFSDEHEMKGKLPWKVEWAVKWKVIGVTVEGAGKDHMSKGGSHDLASLIAKKILDYPIPYAVAYEWFLIGGRKMSTSKGIGTTASDMLDILPPELVRFLIVKSDINQQTNFDPSEKDTIPRLFDDYQEYGEHYFSGKKDDYARIFELSQINEVTAPPKVKFSTLIHWIQMPNMEEEIRKTGAGKWAEYARVWVDRFAPESEKFELQNSLPVQTKGLSAGQKKFLGDLAEQLHSKMTADKMQSLLFDLIGKSGLKPKDAFAAIYISLLGKMFGPKAGPFISSLDYTFVKERLEEACKE